MKLTNILTTIRTNGGRITKVRKHILEVFFQNKCLVSQEQIVQHLNEQELTPNASTIFRELQFLLEKNIITKSTIEKIHYYELNSPHKHYHFICSECQGITALHLHQPLALAELESKYNFKIEQHNIEFKGVCSSCL